VNDSGIFPDAADERSEWSAADVGIFPTTRCPAEMRHIPKVLWGIPLLLCKRGMCVCGGGHVWRQSFHLATYLSTLATPPVCKMPHNVGRIGLVGLVGDMSP